MKLSQLQNYLSHLGITGTLELSGPQGNRVSIKCPYAPWTHARGVDGNPSMGIWLMPDQSVVYHCWACHQGGTLFGMFRELGALREDPELVKLSEQILEVTAPTLESVFAELEDEIPHWGSSKKVQRSSLPLSVLNRFLKATDSPVSWSYLKSRQVSFGICEKFDLRYDPEQHRVVCPVFNELGELVGAVGRDLTGTAHSRYFNYFRFYAGQALGGLKQLKDITNLQRVLVTEGYFDLLRVYPWAAKENTGVVCTWKSEVSTDHCKLLARLDVPVQIWYDNDTAGINGADKAKELGESYGLAVKIARLPDGKDPGELTEDEFRQIRNQTSSNL
jgi:hypothetical protein